MDQSGARDFLYTFGQEHYEAASALVLGQPGELRYGGGPDRTQPANGVHWARVSSTVADSYQETLRLGVRRWVTIGTVFVQLHVPIEDKRAQVHLDKIAELVRNAFRLYQGADVEFTNSVINDSVGAEPAWYRTNVTSTYQYRQFM